MKMLGTPRKRLWRPNVPGRRDVCLFDHRNHVGVDMSNIASREQEGDTVYLIDVLHLRGELLTEYGDLRKERGREKLECCEVRPGDDLGMARPDWTEVEKRNDVSVLVEDDSRETTLRNAAEWAAQCCVGRG